MYFKLWKKTFYNQKLVEKINVVCQKNHGFIIIIISLFAEKTQFTIFKKNFFYVVFRHLKIIASTNRENLFFIITTK